MIVVLEGIDGTGKTEVCLRLASRIGAKLYRTPPECYQARRDEIDRTANDENHYHFYREGVEFASRELAFLAPRGIVVVDRYWMTTVAYHRAMGIDARREDFGSIVEPDTTIYLEVNPEKQRERLAKRGLSIGDKRSLSLQGRVREEYEILIARATRIVRIDTSAMEIDEVVDAIVHAIKPA